MDKDTVRNLISRTIEGVEALVNTGPGEVFIDIPAADPRYIHVEEGDTVQEGDIRSRAEEELESPSLRKWTIEEIDSETVIGTNQDSSEQDEWDRESFERKLATGSFSAKLTDFGRVNVIGESKSTNGEGGDSAADSVTVVAYGNNGQKFTRRYRRIGDEAGGDTHRLEPTESGEGSTEFGIELRERFEQAVERALQEEGYEVQ